MTTNTDAVHRPNWLGPLIINAAPVLAICTGFWEVGHVLVYFWLEAMVILLFNSPRILGAQGTKDERRRELMVHLAVAPAFLAVYLAAVLVLIKMIRHPEGNPLALELDLQLLDVHLFAPELAIFLLLLVIEAAVDLYRDQSYRDRDVVDQMMRPVGLFINHLLLIAIAGVIIGGGLMSSSDTYPILAVVAVMVGVKLFCDFEYYADR